MRTALTLVVACGAMALALVARAGEADGPQAKIKQTTDKILAVLADPALKGDEHKAPRRQKIIAAVDERFNWEDMARRALARHWRGRSADERKQYVALFTDLVRNTYMGKVEGYTGEGVTYGVEKVDGRYARVHVRIKTAKGVLVPVIYSMKQYDGKWLVYDVAIEGVRLVSNYRTQFRSMLDGMNFTKFLDKLKAKVAKLKKGDNDKAGS